MLRGIWRNFGDSKVGRRRKAPPRAALLLHSWTVSGSGGGNARETQVGALAAGGVPAAACGCAAVTTGHSCGPAPQPSRPAAPACASRQGSTAAQCRSHSSLAASCASERRAGGDQSQPAPPLVAQYSACTYPINASRPASRPIAHDSGPEWLGLLRATLSFAISHRFTSAHPRDHQARHPYLPLPSQPHRPRRYRVDQTRGHQPDVAAQAAAEGEDS